MSSPSLPATRPPPSAASAEARGSVVCSPSTNEKPRESGAVEKWDTTRSARARPRTRGRPDAAAAATFGAAGRPAAGAARGSRRRGWPAGFTIPIPAFTMVRSSRSRCARRLARASGGLASADRGIHRSASVPHSAGRQLDRSPAGAAIEYLRAEMSDRRPRARPPPLLPPRRGTPGLGPSERNRAPVRLSSPGPSRGLALFSSTTALRSPRRWREPGHAERGGAAPSLARD
jgi:hypothetical protein